MSELCVYAGSYDPPTLGHSWMIREGSSLFDRLIVAVGVNPEKRPAHSVDQRLSWLREIVGGLPNVEVTQFGRMYLADYASQVGARFILRGIRNAADFGYEQTMRHVNGDLKPGLTTVFLMPPREYAEVSSSLVRGLIGPDGWRDVVARYVPACVLHDLSAAHA
jgi:pantetheine-phosphate adenylyltransferase